jgi:hypothetical protein
MRTGKNFYFSVDFWWESADHKRFGLVTVLYILIMPLHSHQLLFRSAFYSAGERLCATNLMQNEKSKYPVGVTVTLAKLSQAVA